METLTKIAAQNSGRLSFLVRTRYRGRLYKKSKSEEEKEDSGGWFDWITRKTPQEEAALRDVRNNPNIPEGAKP